jgi:CheY-like chemotaxis protein
VLVVEDEFLVRATAVEALEELGYRTVQAASAAEALATLRAADGAIDAVLIDVGLPDGKGDTLAAELRRERPELPIVIATGYDDTALRAAFAADPRVAVLAKPYERRQLGAALAGLRPGRA